MSTAPHTTSAGFPLHAGMFESPPIAIPNRAGDAYKIEQVVERSPERTVKLVWWFGPDDDGTRTVLGVQPAGDVIESAPTIDAGCGDYGGGPEYEATSGTRLPGAPVVRCEERIVRAGDRVHYPLHEFHLVKDVLPGTRTRMTCGTARPGNQWDYLDPRTGRVYPYQEQPDATFVERMMALNPWRRTEQARLDARAAKHDADRLAGLIELLDGFTRQIAAAAKDPAAPVPVLTTA